MKNILLTALSVGVLGLSQTVNAAIVQADWQTTDDNKAFYDTTHNQLWLDLSETVELSINDVTSSLDTTYKGYRIATQDDIIALFSNALTGDEDYSGDYGQAYNSPNGSLLINEYVPYMGVTDAMKWSNKNGSSEFFAARGYYINTELNEVHGAWLMDVQGAQNNDSLVHTYSIGSDKSDSRFSTAGIYLVQDVNLISDVPAPAGLLATSLGILLLSIRRRRTKYRVM